MLNVHSCSGMKEANESLESIDLKSYYSLEHRFCNRLLNVKHGFSLYRWIVARL